ncbi:MAG TPA: dUTP diphosphatase [Candidatus Marinimicrobia bacterium]|jgi:dUTP pyrophosphatase|nr:dUTP diphosphatase [Candidatus Neomarinimicrobiota bacterium]MDP7095407.1 dUTP diphosphatase [Candidatus Neomarinimicrobiota bacterium]MDP7512193.1 dUTP diphosphatase [Candidatus Neomarinimicrobiota bacterium]HJL63280.1 dUTP diphosphatase [Candidatus Neomarinimicrobiota bacterium]HJM11677.1 dUTP diphosphatase [Candidatus Neomarinimicrobiota bacterium]|tara:strand:+ start:337 stop:774 length:438 start_codon:yes stop_codon:yes gene_type:complete
MNLKIKPFNTVVKELYDNHGHFHDGDAGIDLFVINEQTIKAGESTFIHLQIACENTENKPYLVIPRSSIAKTPLRLSNSIGLIDGGYRGEIMAAVDNIKNEDYTVEPGQRLFQLVAMDGSPIHFELVDDLSDTTRGSGGFGSTGK